MSHFKSKLYRSICCKRVFIKPPPVGLRGFRPAQRVQSRHRRVSNPETEMSEREKESLTLLYTDHGTATQRQLTGLKVPTFQSLIRAGKEPAARFRSRDVELGVRSDGREGSAWGRSGSLLLVRWVRRRCSKPNPRFDLVKEQSLKRGPKGDSCRFRVWREEVGWEWMSLGSTRVFFRAFKGGLAPKATDLQVLVMSLEKSLD